MIAIVIGDMPPLLLAFGVLSPRGPFCIPLRMSSSPIFASLAHQAATRSSAHRSKTTQSLLGGRKSVAVLELPRLQAGSEPASTLFGGTMSEGVRDHISLRLTLQPVIANRS